MKNKEFNGFASEAQYEAVKNAVNECVGRSDIEVTFDDFEHTINVDGVDYTFTIRMDYMRKIMIYTSTYFDEVMTIYKNIANIWAVCEQYQPKEANA